MASPTVDLEAYVRSLTEDPDEVWGLMRRAVDLVAQAAPPKIVRIKEALKSDLNYWRTMKRFEQRMKEHRGRSIEEL